MSPLVLSLFPGIGLLDRAFEEAGFCVVRGPDLLWGGDVRGFHPPLGRFDGVIGGPPCQRFSRLRFLVQHNGFDLAPDLIPEFERCVAEARPAWWVMENVPDAPVPSVRGYISQPELLRDVWVGGDTSRLRRFTFGRPDTDPEPFRIEMLALHRTDPLPAVLASGGGRDRPVAIGGSGRPKSSGRISKARDLGYKTRKAAAAAAAAQGLPADFLEDGPFTVAARIKMIGNGWGISQWIGSGWCAGELANGERPSEQKKKPRARAVGALANSATWDGRTNGGRAARGLHAAHVRGQDAHDQHVRPDLTGQQGVTAPRIRDLGNASGWNKRPARGQGGGRGVGRTTLSEQMPALSGDSGATGRGVHGMQVRTEGLYRWMQALAERLRWARVCCGDFERVLGPSVTEKIGTTAVFFDPPYKPGAGRDPSIYAEEDLTAAARAREWALAHGDEPAYRIALCGYEGEHQMPSSWACIPWKASGGYAASAGNTENAHRERIWFSPHCNPVNLPQPVQHQLFEEASGA